MNKKIVHDALILFAFTIVLGLLLGVVYGVTKPSIDKVNEEKTQNADIYQQMFTKKSSEDDDNVDDSAKDDDNSVGGTDEE